MNDLPLFRYRNIVPSPTPPDSAAKYELFYSSGGHVGPYASLTSATHAARVRLNGAPQESYIDIVRRADGEVVVRLSQRGQHHPRPLRKRYFI